MFDTFLKQTNTQTDTPQNNQWWIFSHSSKFSREKKLNWKYRWKDPDESSESNDSGFFILFWAYQAFYTFENGNPFRVENLLAAL